MFPEFFRNMLATVHSAALQGIEADAVLVEVNTGEAGAPALILVGLPDAAVKESEDRVSSALHNSGFQMPRTRTTINLAPGDSSLEKLIRETDDGIYAATIGQVLDKRVLATAQSCWILEAGQTTSGTGRIARYQGGDASDKFATEHQAAIDGDYLAADVSGVGDQAFCTGISVEGMTGVLVRKGSTRVYVSFLDATYAAGQDTTTGPGGADYSPAACKLAENVAAAINP